MEVMCDLCAPAFPILSRFLFPSLLTVPFSIQCLESGVIVVVVFVVIHLAPELRCCAYQELFLVFFLALFLFSDFWFD